MFADIQARLHRLGTEGLQQFINKKGSERKAALHNACQFQTNDWHRTQQTLAEIQRNVNVKRQELANYLAEVEKNRVEADAERASIDTIKAKVVAKEREVEGEKSSGTQSKAFKDACTANLSQMTKQTV